MKLQEGKAPREKLEIEQFKSEPAGKPESVDNDALWREFHERREQNRAARGKYQIYSEEEVDAVNEHHDTVVRQRRELDEEAEELDGKVHELHNKVLRLEALCRRHGIDPNKED